MIRRKFGYTITAMLLKIVIYLPFFFYFSSLNAQSINKKMQKSWIKISIENLSQQSLAPDTLYTRYLFDGQKVNISFAPAWNDYSFDWSLADNTLTVGFETYLLEELTDSTLVFSKPNFRRMRFVSEAYYSKYKNPDTAEHFNEQPVYIASNYLTPRYKKAKSFHTFILDELEKSYNVRHKNTLIAKFVITNQGKIERVRIIKGISATFDEDVIGLIKKTSGNWYPAKIGNIPVNCELTFPIQYLDSISPDLGILDKRTEL